METFYHHSNGLAAIIIGHNAENIQFYDGKVNVILLIFFFFIAKYPKMVRKFNSYYMGVIVVVISLVGKSKTMPKKSQVQLYPMATDQLAFQF